MIDAGHELGALRQGDEGYRVGTDIADVRGAQRQEFAGTVERQFRRYGEITTVIVAKKRLSAIARPFYRTPQTVCCPSRQREFGIRVIARAEISTNVLGNDAYLGRLQIKHVSKIQFGANHSAAARIKGNSTRLWFMNGQSRPYFHGNA